MVPKQTGEGTLIVLVAAISRRPSASAASIAIVFLWFSFKK